MRVRLKNVTAIAFVAASLTIGAAPSTAAPFLPVGAGAWSSTNVTPGLGCGTLSSGTCSVSADSFQTTAVSRETCTNASYVITTPVVVGTNFGCNVRFEATLSVTGSPASQEVESDPLTVEIEAGPCAGLTLSGPKVFVNDGAAGNYEVGVKVTVLNTGWKFQGNLVGLNATTTSAYVLNVAGKIAPACKRLTLRSGDSTVRFSGLFSGSYQFL